MKTLQNNFTTPDQSKWLLELGVPEWTADLYTFYSGKTIVARQNVYERRKDFFTKTRKDGYKPIWSVGRLIEIFDICNLYESHKFSTRDWSVNIKKLMRDYKVATEENMLDFSKLED